MIKTKHLFYSFSLIITMLVPFIYAQEVNVWTKITGQQLGNRSNGALVYCPDSNRYIFAMGSMLQTGGINRYSELCYSSKNGFWMNFLPDTSLYGVWANDTGNAKGLGVCNSTSFGGNPYFRFYKVGNYLRPNLDPTFMSNAYFQYAYRPVDGKIYFYIDNRTSTYDTRLRRWDTLVCASSPTRRETGTNHMYWGSLCYDAFNDEIVMFGGNNVDAKNGSAGTWIFNPNTLNWTKPTLSIEPPPRALSAMVYDSSNHCIVMFGGDHLDYLTADTWIYDCATRSWSQRHPAKTPSPRAGHALVYLPKSGRIALYGGYTYTSCASYVCPQFTCIEPRQLWVYNTSTNDWSLVKAFTAQDSAPNPHSTKAYAAMAAVDTNDRIMILADNVASYSYRSSTYLLACDPSVSNAAGTTTYGVFDGAITRRTGEFTKAWYETGVSAPNKDSISLVFENLPVNQWVRMTPPKAPLMDHIWGDRILDTENDKILVWAGGHSSHCGTDVPMYSISENRWRIGFDAEWPLEMTFDNTQYPSYYSFNERPWMVGHTYDNYGFDPVMKKMILIKSRYSYTFDGAKGDWDSTKIVNPVSMVFDFYNNSVTPTAHGAFAWASTGYYAWGIFIMDTSIHTWRRLRTTPTTLPGYMTESGGAAYDSKRDRVVMFSSWSDATKVWSYNFSDSTLTVTTPSGTIFSGWFNRRTATYLPGADKILFSGDSVNPVYNCATNAWERLTFTKGSGVGTTNTVSSGYNFDTKRGLLWNVEQNFQTYVLKLSSETVTSESHRTQGSIIQMSATPNPFNPSTTLRITMTKTDHAIIAVYNVKGEKVAILANCILVKGEQNFKFVGGSLASGAYFVRLTTGSRTLQKQLILLK